MLFAVASYIHAYTQAHTQSCKGGNGLKTSVIEQKTQLQTPNNKDNKDHKCSGLFRRHFMYTNTNCTCNSIILSYYRQTHNI